MKNFLKKYFIAGLVVIIPIAATIWILKVLIIWLDGFFFSFLPQQLRPEYWLGYSLPGLGLVVTLGLVLLCGVFTRLYIGRKFVQLGDSFFARLPFGRAIYQATKQLMHSTLSEGATKNRRVVLVEYPIEGTYAIGFLTGEWKKTDPDKDQVMVFVPTAPNPTSGFLLIVQREKVIQTDLSPEDASKLLISGGLLAKREDLA